MRPALVRAAMVGGVAAGGWLVASGTAAATEAHPGSHPEQHAPEQSVVGAPHGKHAKPLPAAAAASRGALDDLLGKSPRSDDAVHHTPKHARHHARPDVRPEHHALRPTHPSTDRSVRDDRQRLRAAVARVDVLPALVGRATDALAEGMTGSTAPLTTTVHRTLHAAAEVPGPVAGALAAPLEPAPAAVRDAHAAPTTVATGPFRDAAPSAANSPTDRASGPASAGVLAPAPYAPASPRAPAPATPTVPAPSSADSRDGGPQNASANLPSGGVTAAPTALHSGTAARGSGPLEQASRPAVSPD